MSGVRKAKRRDATTGQELARFRSRKSSFDGMRWEIPFSFHAEVLERLKPIR